MQTSREFWEFVKPSGKGDCWLWTRGVGSHGYGKLTWGNKVTLAHRVAYELAHGSIPQSESKYDTVVMHSCDTKLCCNPDHLRLGTQADNMKDMQSKGRGRK